jgi:hypothetical protein
VLTKSLQIRDVILNCGKGFSEWNVIQENIRYYYNPDNAFVELKMREDYIKEEIELLVELIGITFEDFEILYRKARKHKL